MDVQHRLLVTFGLRRGKDFKLCSFLFPHLCAAAHIKEETCFHLAILLACLLPRSPLESLQPSGDKGSQEAEDSQECESTEAGLTYRTQSRSIPFMEADWDQYQPIRG